MEFRNPSSLEGLQRLRDLLRGHSPHIMPMPNGQQGFVVEDLDLVLRWYGKNFGLDNEGRLRLCEVKYGQTPIAKAQKMTFKLLAAIIGKNHPRFDGYFIIQTSDDLHNENTTYHIFRIDGVIVKDITLTARQFCKWCLTPYHDKYIQDAK